MEIEDTSLYREFESIAKRGSQPVHYFWECRIRANGEDITPFMVVSIDFVRDYDKVYSDAINIELSIGRGTFIHRIAPFKENLVVTLTKNPVGEVNDDINYDVTTQKYVMRGILIDQADHAIEGNNPQQQGEEIANMSGPVPIKMQLVDPALEQVRMKTMGGIFRDAAPGYALQAIMTQACQNIDVDETNRIRGVDLVEPSNQQKRRHVIVPHGTRLPHLPEYIQDHCGGVYNSGIGHYLQQGIWYIYPEFNVNRFNETDRTLTIVNIPPNKLPGIERTYYFDGKKLIVLSTGQVKHHDDTESLQYNYGNGVRYARADKMLENFAEVETNTATAHRKKNNREYLAKNRKTGLNTIFMSDNRITSNDYRETSKLARRSGAHLEVVWENSNGDMIYPGMPARMLYVENDKVKEVYGVVLRAHTFIGAVGQGQNISRHRSTTHLVLFTRKN